jgi:hypothetical protein
MYNVLEKLRTGEALTAKEKDIHDKGLVTVLKQIHDEIDRAVLEAYNWLDLLESNGPETQDGKTQDTRGAAGRATKSKSEKPKCWTAGATPTLSGATPLWRTSHHLPSCNRTLTTATSPSKRNTNRSPGSRSSPLHPSSLNLHPLPPSPTVSPVPDLTPTLSPNRSSAAWSPSTTNAPPRKNPATSAGSAPTTRPRKPPVPTLQSFILHTSTFSTQTSLDLPPISFRFILHPSTFILGPHPLAGRLALPSPCHPQPPPRPRPRPRRPLRRLRYGRARKGKTRSPASSRRWRRWGKFNETAPKIAAHCRSHHRFGGSLRSI